MPNFFISYRRADREGNYLAHNLYRELKSRFGNDSVFLDVDQRKPGIPFPDKVKNALDLSDVMLAVIGPDWLKILQDRKEEERDWVRFEVAQGLGRAHYPVVPVLCPGVEVPTRSELPSELEDLHWRDGITVDPFQDFEIHVARALIDIEDVLKELEQAKAKAEEKAKLEAVQLPSKGVSGSKEPKIQFVCPSCSAKLRVPKRLAGISGPCPKCGATIVAPLQSSD